MHVIRKLSKNIVSGILALSLLATSFSGAYAPVAYADAPDEIASEEAVHNAKTDKGILAGLLAVGLLAALTGHGDSADSPAPSKSTAPSTNPDSNYPTPSQPTTSSASDEQLAFNLLNQDRAKYGLPALKYNAQLTVLARNYARDMINRNFFAHTDPDGLSPFDRMSRAGISYRTAGENLAINSSVTDAEKAFMNSPGHRANILSANYTEVGVGVVRAANGQVYVVQEFIGR
ncbi:MAG: CAP domain-containing protein [Negativicutes bacterium]|nr:CAP domain-containing protein [Negativicutes bacterium]